MERRSGPVEFVFQVDYRPRYRPHAYREHGEGRQAVDVLPAAAPGQALSPKQSGGLLMGAIRRSIGASQTRRRARLGHPSGSANVPDIHGGDIRLDWPPHPRAPGPMTRTALRSAPGTPSAIRTALRSGPRTPSALRSALDSAVQGSRSFGATRSAVRTPPAVPDRVRRRRRSTALRRTRSPARRAG
jgi:hypothetical protein